MKQWFKAVKKVVSKMDLEHLDDDRYKNLYRKAIYVPGLGRFSVNWGYIKKYQEKYGIDGLKGYNAMLEKDTEEELNLGEDENKD